MKPAGTFCAEAAALPSTMPAIARIELRLGRLRSSRVRGTAAFGARIILVTLFPLIPHALHAGAVRARGAPECFITGSAGSIGPIHTIPVITFSEQ
jgi:hypothetical protein